jgi:ribosome-binding protein aMBF1 (putative translation factor)
MKLFFNKNKMSDCQDWNPVTIGKQKKSIATRKKEETMYGSVDSSHTNKQASFPKQQSNRRVAEDTMGEEDVRKKKKTYTTEFRNRMQQARKEKNLTQKQLAARLSIKPALIGEIESGKADWDGSLVVKIERVLGSLRK